MKTSAACPQCHRPYSLIAGIIERTPYEVTCRHCKTTFKVNLRGNKIMFILFRVVLAGLFLGSLYGMTLDEPNTFVIFLGAAFVIWIAYEIGIGLLIFNFGTLTIKEDGDRSQIPRAGHIVSYGQEPTSYRAEIAKFASMLSAQVQTTISNVPGQSWAILASVVLVLSSTAILFSLWGVLFGPDDGALLSVMGFLIGFAAIAGAHKTSIGKKAIASVPYGLSQIFPALLRFRRPLKVLIAAALTATTFALAGFFWTGVYLHEGGVKHTPVFDERPVYLLVNHGQTKEVSRLHYILNGTSFFLGWHSGALLMSLGPLYFLLYGRLPKLLKKYWGDHSDES